MATMTATSLLGLSLPVSGQLSGTWGDTVNNSITSLLDSAVAGTTTLSTDADVTLTTTDYAANQARQAVLLCTGARTVLRTITAPARSKTYIVINSTTGGFSVKLVGVGPTTPGVTVIAGEYVVCAWNGSDFVKVASNTITQLTGVLAAANGGTGQSSYTIGDLLYASGATTLSKLADVATGNAVISGGVGVAPSYGKIGLTTHVSGTLPVANGGTNATTASITSFNNITGYSASGATGTTSTNLVFSTSPTLITPALGTPSALVGTNITGTASGLTAGNVTTNANLTGAVTSVGNATSLGSFTSLQLNTALTDETGSGAAVFATSPTLVTPALGTPSALVGTNITGTASGLTAGNVTTNADLTGAITSVGNATSLGSFTSAQLRTALTNETGTGGAVFATSPTIATATLTGANTIQGLTVGLGGGAVASNTAVGIGTLATNSTGTYNTAVGLNALNAATIADENTAVGHAALQSASTGANNTAVGNNALGNLITGNQNVAIGDGALSNLDGYASNVAVGPSAMSTAQCDEAVGVGFSAVASNTATGTVGIGSLALYSNTSGVGQTAVGYYALQLSTGGGNTAMGYQAGSAVTTGANNTILGAYTGVAAPISATGSNWIVLSDGAGSVRQAIDSAGNSQFLTGAVVVYAPEPATFSGAATLTNANLQTQILVASGLSYTLTMPTGSTLDTLISWAGVNLGFDFSLINAASASVSLGTSTGVTNIGILSVTASTSGRFRIRRTAASTYIVYRIG